MTKAYIKICGVKDKKILNFIVSHKYAPKFIGFICNYPKSHRNLSLEKLKTLLDVKKHKSNFVAVLVSPNLNYLKNSSSILIFTGDGSKILDKNSIYLKDEYKFFNDMTFFEENTDSICEAGYLFHTSEKSDEILIVPKTYKKQGFFEKLFYYFSR